MPSASATAFWVPKCSTTSEVRMPGLLAAPNDKSIGAPYGHAGILLGMPPTALARRLIRIREAAGFGGDRMKAKFARKIGITPPSLADLESGETKELGAKSLIGYLLAGANLKYIQDGKGVPVFKDIERNLRAQTILSQMMELEESELSSVESIVKAYIRAKPGGSENDPFKRDPPKENE